MLLHKYLLLTVWNKIQRAKWKVNALWRKLIFPRSPIFFQKFREAFQKVGTSTFPKNLEGLDFPKKPKVSLSQKVSILYTLIIRHKVKQNPTGKMQEHNLFFLSQFNKPNCSVGVFDLRWHLHPLCSNTVVRLVIPWRVPGGLPPRTGTTGSETPRSGSCFAGGCSGSQV